MKVVIDLIYGFESGFILIKVAPSLLLMPLLMPHYSLQMLHHMLKHNIKKGLFHFFKAIAKVCFQ